MTAAAPSRIARVAFNVRVYKTFDYVLPPQIDSAAAAKACIGCRVQAPFGSKQAVGVIVSLADASSLPTSKLKTISKIYDDMPPLPASFLKMIQFCSSYYHCPIGIAMATALPAFFRRANEYHMPKKHAAQESSTTLSIPNTPPPLAHPPLTDEQQNAINKLKLNDGFAPHLLFGKTGSGKTAVYLHAIHNRLAAGKQTLFLTPEIHLIPQLEQTLRAHFGSYRIAVLHSGVSDGERAHRWLAAARGECDIILGTRLAVFTPLPRLGLIVIDEEHDESYKQEDRLPFSAKNIAIWRAQNESLPYIAGSATPSLESYHLHAAQRCLRMNRRISSIKTDATKSSDNTRDKTAAKKNNEAAARFHFIDDNPQTQFHGLQPTFINALKKHLAAERQALIFINRRGYAPTLFCGNCQVAQQCSRCSVAMTVHKQRQCLMCHHCGQTQPLPTHCPQCEGILTARGSGTQRIEHALEKLFPQHPQCRLDRDALQPTSESFAAREADIVSNRTRIIIGTQIIAKGHNFPHLSFIGLLNTDRSLHAVDFRAEERAYAMLSQVVGRGMRHPQGCDVFIQTKHTAHPFYTALAHDEVEPYWQQLLDERRKAGLPPFTHLALLRARAKSAAVVERFMSKAINIARPLAQSGIDIYDSVPPAIEKVGGYHHRHCMIRARNRRNLQAFLNAWRQQIPTTSIHWSLDIDPTSV